MCGIKTSSISLPINVCPNKPLMIIAPHISSRLLQKCKLFTLHKLSRE